MKYLHWRGIAELFEKNGGQGRTDSQSESGRRSRPKGENRPKSIRINRSADTRIFSREQDRLRLYISKSCRGVRCLICSTVHNRAQLIHAKLTLKISYVERPFTMHFLRRNYRGFERCRFTFSIFHSNAG